MLRCHPRSPSSPFGPTTRRLWTDTLEMSPQDYSSIISLVDALRSLPTCDVAEQPNVRFHYAFALSR